MRYQGEGEFACTISAFVALVSEGGRCPFGASWSWCCVLILRNIQKSIYIWLVVERQSSCKNLVVRREFATTIDSWDSLIMDTTFLTAVPYVDVYRITSYVINILHRSYQLPFRHRVW